MPSDAISVQGLCLLLRRRRRACADARRRADRHHPVRHVAVDHRARARARAASDAHRRHEHRVAADERAVADRRAVLALAVVVRRDRAGADVHVVADLGVADVAEVAHLRAAAQPRRLHLREVADVHALARCATPGAGGCTGPCRRPSSSVDSSTVENRTVQPSPMRESRISVPGPIVAAAPIVGAPCRCVFGSIVVSGPIVTSRIDERRRRIDDASRPRACGARRMRSRIVASASASCTRSLIPRTSIGSRRRHGDRRVPFVVRHRRELREVALAVRRRRRCAPGAATATTRAPRTARS